MLKLKKNKRVTAQAMRLIFIAMALASSSSAFAASNPCNIYMEDLAPKDIMNSYHTLSPEVRSQLEKFRDDLQSKGYHVVYNKADANISLYSFYTGCAEKTQSVPAVCGLAYTKVEFSSSSSPSLAVYGDQAEASHLAYMYLPASVDTTYKNTLNQIPNCQASGN